MTVAEYPVTWSDEAIKNKNDIIGYLQQNWTENEIKKFVQRLDAHILDIARFPEMFRKTNQQSNWHRSVLSKQHIIYYKFENQTVEIGFIFDTRQDPNRLNLNN